MTAFLKKISSNKFEYHSSSPTPTSKFFIGHDHIVHEEKEPPYLLNEQSPVTLDSHDDGIVSMKLNSGRKTTIIPFTNMD